MIDNREWKQHREMVMHASDMMSAQARRDMAFMSPGSNRQRILSQVMIGLVTAGMLITGLLSFADAANGTAVVSVSPAGSMSAAKLGMSYYSDYLFVLAVPFAVALLGHVSVTLSRIAKKLG